MLLGGEKGFGETRRIGGEGAIGENAGGPGRPEQRGLGVVVVLGGRLTCELW